MSDAWRDGARAGRPDELEPAGDGEPAEDAALPDAAWVSCPYCGESVEVLLDLGGGAVQEYVEDCEVCCRPWSLRVELTAAGTTVTVTSLDE